MAKINVEESRKQYLDGFFKATENLDKQINFISTGSFLVISFMMEKIFKIEDATNIGTILTAVGGFCLSAVIGLVANWNSKEVYKWALNNVNKGDSLDTFESQLKMKGRLTSFLNNIQIWAVLISIILTAIYVINNFQYRVNTHKDKLKLEKVSKHCSGCCNDTLKK